MSILVLLVVINTVVDVEIFSVDVVGVSDVDVSISFVDVVVIVGVVIFPVVDISSLDEVVVSDNVVILLVFVDGNKVFCVVCICSSVRVVIKKRKNKYYAQRSNLRAPFSYL